MTDSWLMEAGCVHGVVWFACDQCAAQGHDAHRTGLERLRRLDLPGDEGPGVTLMSLAADEIARLRAAVAKIRDLHQPLWVSEEAKAAGKEPWVCCWCGTADGSWPCDTRLMADDALAPEQGDDR